ncbi:MAG: hypothetical protein FIA92_14955 [Chloroflexi bacterium]|nr:hypothetical protein [Chloroflexota bacterium]
MGVINTTRRPQDDSANVGIDMSDTLAMLDPSDVPLLSLIGKDGLTATALKHEWLEDALRPLDTAIATQGEFSGTGAVSTATVTAGQGVYLRAGDILLIDSELMKLDSISTDTLAIAAGSRGWGGSTAASHASLAAIKIVGNVNLTDASAGASRSTTKTGFYNYCQLYEDVVTTTTTTQAIKKWVPGDDLDREIAKALKVAWMQWERALLFGRKVQPTTTVPGSMDGILVRLTTNAYAKAGAYLTEEFVLQAMQDSWNAGGRIDTLVANAFQKRQLNKFLDSQRMTTRTDRIAGSIVDTYTSDFGTADIVLDRHMPTDTVLLLDRPRVKFGPLTGHPLSVGDVETSTRLKKSRQVIAQYTSELRNESAHAKITGLATS